jgi:protocatechuate 3,4-dioxygenase beta subunit
MRNLLFTLVIFTLFLLLLFLAGCSQIRASLIQPATSTMKPSPSIPVPNPGIGENPAKSTSTEESPRPVEPSPTLAAGPQPLTCSLTPSDMLGPFYTPGAPQREKVGEGYTLFGVVRSIIDCQPIAGAQIEFWLAGPNGEYSDDYRASMFSGLDGSYRFESDFPPPYSGRPSHIHMKVSADGYETLVTQHYPDAGDKQAELDLVLQPGP